MAPRLKTTRKTQQREKLLFNGSDKVSFILSVQKEVLEHMFNSYELSCVRAKPTQNAIKHIVIGGVRFPIYHK